MTENRKKLFVEFPPVSTQEWEQRIHEDLKGADYDKKLVWKTIEGFAVKPYYRSEDIEKLEFVKTLPAEFPYVRGNQTCCNYWEIRQDILVDEIGVEAANKKALDILMKGVTSIGFVTENTEMSPDDFSKLLNGIVLTAVEINFVSIGAAWAMLKLLTAEVKKQNLDATKIHGSVSLDPFGNLTISGNFCDTADKCYDTCHDAILFAKENLPNFKVLGINAHFFHNCGASAVQELGFALSVANEYLTILTNKNISIDVLAPRIKFNFAVGSSYFIEIAKLRAARLLWSKIVEQYKPTDLTVAKMNIHCTTSLWNKTACDAHVNMLRSTTEAMSAIIGGTDSLQVDAFDKSFRTANDFSERIARNQQIILKEESYLDKVVDPSAGSYYIENLTNSIAEHAWKLFLEVENKQGYYKAFEDGFIQSQIEATANTRNMNIATRRDVILGTNQFPSAGEKITNFFETNYTPFIKGLSELPPVGRPLKPYRGAMAFEELRLKTESQPKTPKVFLLIFGNLAMRKARAMFATNFFGCAGFEVIENAGFKTIDDGINAAIASKAEIVVLCSSDDEYATTVPTAIEALKDKAIVVLAGYPTALVEQFKTLGLKYFVHVKSNVLETLQDFQKELKF